MGEVEDEERKKKSVRLQLEVAGGGRIWPAKTDGMGGGESVE